MVENIGEKNEKLEGVGVRRTLPVLLTLCVTFNSWSESLGRTSGIDPPVACLFHTTHTVNVML